MLKQTVSLFVSYYYVEDGCKHTSNATLEVDYYPRNAENIREIEEAIRLKGGFEYVALINYKIMEGG